MWEMHTTERRCVSTLYRHQCQRKRDHPGSHYAETTLTASGEMIWTDDPFDDGGLKNLGESYSKP